MGFWDDAEVISVYTRAQALEDGALVDVSQAASEVGVKWPVAVTAAVWADINDIPEGKQGIVDWRGRLHDLLWMYTRAAVGDIYHRKISNRELVYGFRMDIGRKKSYEVKAVSGPGDHMEPVITLMTPSED